MNYQQRVTTKEFREGWEDIFKPNNSHTQAQYTTETTTYTTSQKQIILYNKQKH